jgi:hypothetical protein
MHCWKDSVLREKDCTGHEQRCERVGAVFIQAWSGSLESFGTVRGIREVKPFQWGTVDQH